MAGDVDEALHLVDKADVELDGRVDAAADDFRSFAINLRGYAESARR